MTLLKEREKGENCPVDICFFLWVRRKRSLKQRGLGNLVIVFGFTFGYTVLASLQSPRALGWEDGKPKKRAQALGSCSCCAAENASLFRVQLFHFPLLAPGIPVHKHFVGKYAFQIPNWGKELTLMVVFSTFRTCVSVALRLFQSLGLPCSDNGHRTQVLGVLQPKEGSWPVFWILAGLFCDPGPMDKLLHFSFKVWS